MPPLLPYGDNSNFVNADNPWFIRGGHVNNGAAAGVWAVNRNNGNGNWNNGWRAVQRGLIRKWLYPCVSYTRFPRGPNVKAD